MTLEKNTQTDEIIEGIAAGMTAAELIVALSDNMSPQAVYNRLSDLVREGRLCRTGRGTYSVPEVNKPANGNGNGHGGRHENSNPPKNGNGNHNIAEREKRRIALPEYMRSRPAITLYVEHSPLELEQVVRLELEIGGIWLPIQVNGDLRVCVGTDIPRWSAMQETYNGVTAYRVTYRNGDQYDYNHNPRVPFTLDLK